MNMQLIDPNNNAQLTTQGEQRYRVVLVHPSAGVNWSGGTEIFAIELARRLNAYFEVELLSGAASDPLFYAVGGISRVDAYHMVRHPLIAPLLQRFTTHPAILIEHLTSFFPCAIRLLRQPANLIFPCNDYGGLAMAAFVRAIIGTPILFTEHGSFLGGGRTLSRNLRFRPDRLVVFHETVAAFVQSLRPSQPVSIIPNGVDLDRFTPEGSCIDFALTRPIVLCVASLARHDHKRVELAIQAMRQLPQASLLLCGNGPDRAYYQALGDELFGSKRFAIRSFSHERMPEVYRSADAFTLPSLNEPFALSYMEAMASGLPVVTTDDEIRRYIVADAGIVCDVTNPDTYAAALTEVLSGEWGWRARHNAMRFSWDVIALHYRDLILQTITQSRKA
jgi:glycosyltransferase involved in cell wall biosynthesis